MTGLTETLTENLLTAKAKSLRKQ